MVTPLDALTMAIFQYETGAKPGPSVRSIRNNNPGNLRPYADNQPTDGENYRIFPTFSDGWAALQSDLSHKLKAHLSADAVLLDLFNIYAPSEDHNHPNSYAQFVCRWMSGALGKSINMNTKVSEIF